MKTSIAQGGFRRSSRFPRQRVGKFRPLFRQVGQRLQQLASIADGCAHVRMESWIPSDIGGLAMLHYAVVFFIIALIAALFGFTGIAAGAAGIAKILFIVFLVMALATFILNVIRKT